MTFELPNLDYPHDALEPYIDATTMRLHHDRHHATYVEKAVDALRGTDLEDRPVEEVLANLDRLPEDRRTPVRNNAGGHANHSLFWRVMGPPAGAGPGDAMADALQQRFGGFDPFRDAFTAAAVGVFGSGWAWLVSTSGGLEIITTPNQDSPLMSGQTPILGLDVWEHAYYLNYENRRPEYVKAWWNVVDWEAVEGRYHQVGQATAAAGGV